jgi:type I restriction enzyme S subunit
MNPDRLLKHYERIAEAPDAIARLRRFVLDLAVRGKLVPQDPRDEPASELLKRIAAEKARLVKAGEIRNPKEFPLEDYELPFAAPHGWAITILDRLSPRSLSDGDWIETKDQSKDGGVRLIQLADVGVGEFLNKSARYITEETEVRLNCTRLVVGDVLIARLPNPIGRACIFPDIGQQAITAVDVAILRPDENISGQFLVLAMNAPPIREQIEAYGKGTTRFRVSTGHLKTVLIPLPPLPEQHRIVAKVDELMALCDRLEAARVEREATRDGLTAASLARLNAPDPDTFRDDARFALDALPALTTRPDQIKQLRQTILNLAVRGKLVPQDRDDEPASELLKRIEKEKARLIKAGEIKSDQSLPPLEPSDVPFVLPRSWNWCRLRELAIILGDGLHGTPNYSEGSDYYFINGNNLEDGKIVIKPNTKTVSLDEWKKHKKQLTSNSVLVSINGTLGKVAFYNGEKIILGKSACYFNLTDLTDKRFVKVVLDSPYFADYAVNSATGTTIMNLSIKAMNEFPIPLPPLAEQHRIVAKVDELMGLCDRLEARLTTADDTRRRLLDALLAEALAPAEALDREAAE